MNMHNGEVIKEVIIISGKAIFICKRDKFVRESLEIEILHINSTLILNLLIY